MAAYQILHEEEGLYHQVAYFSPEGQPSCLKLSEVQELGAQTIYLTESAAYLLLAFLQENLKKKEDLPAGTYRHPRGFILDRADSPPEDFGDDEGA